MASSLSTFGPTVATAASRQAERNWVANRQAADATQPSLVADLPVEMPALEWLYGRDRSLTAMTESGRWFAGCSLPRRAARAMLKTLSANGPVACFLLPPHAAHLRVALDMLTPQQAILAVVPDREALAVMLGCEDFAADIAAHRLWFAWGEGWAGRMAELFDAQPGLPTPAQFIRLQGVEAEVLDPVIAAAQQVFPAVNARRAAGLHELRQAWRPSARTTRRIGVVTTSAFRLWDDTGLVLSELASGPAPAGVEYTIHVADDPAAASPLGMALAASECDALLLANASREDTPGLFPAELPLVTWVTRPGRIPAGASRGPKDALIVADPGWRDAALRAGWPAERVAVGTWPVLVNDPPPAKPSIGIISDTGPLEPPAALEEFSSHLLLWNTIRQELTDDPLVAGTDALGYLNDRIRRYGVAEEGLDRTLFVERLIVPCFEQAVAGRLVSAGLPLALYGAGWEAIDEFAPHAAGQVTDRHQLRQAIARSTAIVHCWPAANAHPIEFAGRPVVRTAGRNAAAILFDARVALAVSGTGQPAVPPICLGAIARIARCDAM